MQRLAARALINEPALLFPLRVGGDSSKVPAAHSIFAPGISEL